MAIVNGVDYGQRVWTSNVRVDMRKRPGRGDLPDGVYASKFGNGLQTGSCIACREVLAGYVSLAAAFEKGFTCGMYGQDAEQLTYCFRQARPARRS